jgi:hypothetical protein
MTYLLLKLSIDKEKNSIKLMDDQAQFKNVSLGASPIYNCSSYESNAGNMFSIFYSIE